MSARRFEFLNLEVRGAIAEVTLDRPPVNAVNQAMYVEIRELFSNILDIAPGARVAILGGAGRHFCAGNDLEEFLELTPELAAGRMTEVRSAFFAISDCPLPVIAAVQGVALGTGLALAASCDFIIAAAGAKLGLPEVGVGVMGGARHLARLAPQPVVRWMFLSAEPMPVEALLRYGVVLEVVPEDRLLDATRSRANALLAHSPVALRTAKLALNTIESMELKSGYTYEQSLTAALSAHPHHKEALRAVLEKRPPVYDSDPA
jgi:enoyl-CoA hydratase